MNARQAQGFILTLIGLFVWSMAPVFAQSSSKSPDLELLFQVVKAEKAPAQRILSSEHWQQALQQRGFQILEEGFVPTKLDRDILVFLGTKHPITYRDPRSSGHQVQYTDVGSKMDCLVKELSGGNLRVNTRIETSGLAPDEISADCRNVYLVETVVHMRRGQTAILASTQGVITSRFLSLFLGDGEFKDSDLVLFALTVK